MFQIILSTGSKRSKVGLKKVFQSVHDMHTEINKTTMSYLNGKVCKWKLSEATLSSVTESSCLGHLNALCGMSYDQNDSHTFLHFHKSLESKFGYSLHICGENTSGNVLSAFWAAGTLPEGQQAHTCSHRTALRLLFVTSLIFGTPAAPLNKAYQFSC